MAVTDQVPRADYLGNGTADEFDADFPVLDVADLVIYETDADGVVTTKTIPTNYAAVHNADRTVTLTRVAGVLPSGYAVAILGQPDVVQPVQLTRGGGYRPDIVERALDRTTLQVQGVKEMARHAIRFPLSEDVDGELPSATERASKLLGFDPDGNLALSTPTAGGGGGSGSGVGVSVTDEEFGATGSGITLDTSAIQAAIDYVNSRGGGVVYFPAGIYLIDVAQTASSTWKHCLTLRPGVTLRGESRERSIIKLKDNAGNYRSIFARAAISDTDMDDVGILDLTIDQNNTNNAPAAMSDLTTNGGSRHVLVNFGGRRNVVRNVRIKDIKSINTLVFNAPIGLTGDVQVSGCLFELGASATIDNDHSTIYTSADDVVIAGNVFSSPAPNTYGATTAIEPHGSQHAIYGNTIKNFRNGANLTGLAVESNNLNFSLNVIEGGCYGVVLWSGFFGSNVDQPALRNFTIAKNQIMLNRDPWVSGANISAGVFFDQTYPNQAPCESVNIDGNLIWFAPTTETNVSDQYSCGVCWDRPTIGGVGYDRDITITDNIIVGAPANGIRVSAAFRNLTISGNTIRNCGQSTNGAFVTAYRAAIMCFPPAACHHIHVHHNKFIDDQVTPTMTYGLVHGNASFTDCRFEDNVWGVSAAHGNPVYYGSFVAGAGWYVRHVCDTYHEDIIGQVKAGSSILETDTGTTRTQVTAPQGFVYAASVATAFPPFEIPVGKTDGSGALTSYDSFRAIFAGASQILLGKDGLPGSFIADGDEDEGQGYRWYRSGGIRAALILAGTESGGDAGSDVALVMYDDAGAFIDVPVVFGRAASARVDFNRHVNVDVGHEYRLNNLKVIGERALGWTTLPTGTLSRLTFDTATVTTQQLAQRVAALITDLHALSTNHALIGA